MDMLDVVTLLEDLTAEGLKKGDQGVIIDIFQEPTLAYEVEFCDSEGRTVAQVTLTSEQMKVVRHE
jgi:hypothetical protein